MALKLTYSSQGINHTDSYHRITFGVRDQKKKEQQILIKIYASEPYADSHPDDYFDREIIWVHPSDFDIYLDIIEYEKNQLYPEKAAYTLLKTIDPTAINSKYPNCRFNYKNDSTDI